MSWIDDTPKLRMTATLEEILSSERFQRVHVRWLNALDPSKKRTVPNCLLFFQTMTGLPYEWWPKLSEAQQDVWREAGNEAYSNPHQPLTRRPKGNKARPSATNQGASRSGVARTDVPPGNQPEFEQGSSMSQAVFIPYEESRSKRRRVSDAKSKSQRKSKRKAKAKTKKAERYEPYSSAAAGPSLPATIALPPTSGVQASPSDWSYESASSFGGSTPSSGQYDFRHLSISPLGDRRHTTASYATSNDLDIIDPSGALWPPTTRGLATSALGLYGEGFPPIEPFPPSVPDRYQSNPEAPSDSVARVSLHNFPRYPDMNHRRSMSASSDLPPAPSSLYPIPSGTQWNNPPRHFSDHPGTDDSRETSVTYYESSPIGPVPSDTARNPPYHLLAYPSLDIRQNMGTSAYGARTPSSATHAVSRDMTNTTSNYPPCPTNDLLSLSCATPQETQAPYRTDRSPFSLVQEPTVDQRFIEEAGTSFTEEELQWMAEEVAVQPMIEKDGVELDQYYNDPGASQ
ncbi:hypothetical protein NEOLEDRAFT_360173 [Neolentinus lepideus HHB14362 ss-1]|uniref:Uncharacterized protein n=1 Tax=Neolentinus lepideus HHB14362 ss-1 TaxID=1314782 RepID=A0A165SMR8_9AGAM|nr:hypothetical protein NEOLEDRAFT_360173 [Neolentinus lepideus HHB14362 ss-1]